MTQQTTDWATQLLELYKMGCSDAEVAAEMKMPISQYRQQIKDNVTFAKLVEFGRTYSQAFWEGQGRKNIGNKSFNTPLWSFYMKNKFGWADKSEVIAQNENINTDLDGLRTQVNAQVESFIKKHKPELTDAKLLLSEIGKEIVNDQE